MAQTPDCSITQSSPPYQRRIRLNRVGRRWNFTAAGSDPRPWRPCAFTEEKLGTLPASKEGIHIDENAEDKKDINDQSLESPPFRYPFRSPSESGRTHVVVGVGFGDGNLDAEHGWLVHGDYNLVSTPFRFSFRTPNSRLLNIAGPLRWWVGDFKSEPAPFMLSMIDSSHGGFLETKAEASPTWVKRARDSVDSEEKKILLFPFGPWD